MIKTSEEENKFILIGDNQSNIEKCIGLNYSNEEEREEKTHLESLPACLEWRCFPETHWRGELLFPSSDPGTP